MRAFLNRRQALALSAGAVAGLAAPAGQAGDRQPIRIGIVLPGRTDQPILLDGSSEVIAAAMARCGAVMAEEEYGLNASLFGRRLDLVRADAPSPEAASRAGERLIAAEGVCAIIGGYHGQAHALQDAAARGNALFFNIGSSLDSLRKADCRSTTFHVEASAAMYLDALAAFFVRAGFRNWFLVQPENETGKAIAARARSALEERHWGAREAGHATVDPLRPEFSGIVDKIRGAKPDLVVLLLPWLAQLDFLAHYEKSGLEAMVTGFPDPVTQTREFLATAREQAPATTSGRRLVLWEASLDAYGARELNERFYDRWGMAMDGPAWTAYQSVKIVFETAMAVEALDAPPMVSHLEDPKTVFDVHKGIGVSFRPWDHQLRQTIYLIRVDPTSTGALDLAVLEGELPAIYMPGTDPVERLDQIGDLAFSSTSCTG